MPTTNNFSVKQEFNKRFDSLKQESQKWQPAWKDLRTYIDQTRGIFDGDRSVIGKMVNHKVLLDSKASMAVRVTSSGMQTGMSDPSRPWFRITLEEALMQAYPRLKEWLDEVQGRMLEVLNKSNLYGVLYSTYYELCQFGTACFMLLSDFEDVVRGRSFTCGEYYLGTDNKGRVNAFARDFEMTVTQLVAEFGFESLSPQIQGLWLTNRVDEVVKVRHVIEPNQTKSASMVDFGNMAYRSVYWEAGDGSNDFLAKRGYRRFPVIAPRWDSVTTDMVYGVGPGFHAIGDIKELQMTHKDMLLAQEKLHNPPVQADAAVQGHANLVPGGVTKITGNVPNSGVRPSYQVNPNLDSFQLSIENLHAKIDKHFFADIFLMITMMDRTDKTAFEIAQRQQEKMMMLGPILHKLNEELHDRLVELVFYEMLEAGLFPEAPEELQGQELKIQYISILAQAQRSLGVTQIERVVGFVGNLAQVFPGATDNIDIDETVREVAELEGVPAKLIMDKDEIAALREQRAKQQAIMASTEMANSAADTTKKLSETEMDKNSALDGLTQGYR